MNACKQLVSWNTQLYHGLFKKWYGAIYDAESLQECQNYNEWLNVTPAKITE